LKLEDALALQQKLFDRRMELRWAKGNDYASEEDCLLNFKTAAKLCDIFNIDMTKSYGVAFMYKLLKLQREANLIFNNKQPKNESLIDTLLDLSNYNDLELECLIDEGVVTVE